MHKIMRISMILVIVALLVSFIGVGIVFFRSKYPKEMIEINDINALLRCKKIHDSCNVYKKANGFYPDSLMIMGMDSPPYIEMELANGRSPGYQYYYSKTSSGFTLRAIPVEMDKTGSCIFSTNEGKEIFIFDRHGLVDKKVFEEPVLYH